VSFNSVVTFSSGTINLTAPITLNAAIAYSPYPVLAIPNIHFNSTSPNSQSVGRIVSTGDWLGEVYVGSGATLTCDGIPSALNMAQDSTVLVRKGGGDSGTTVLSFYPSEGPYTIDISDNKLFVPVLRGMPGLDRNAFISSVANRLNAGFNGGDWLGKGITSSTVAADNCATGSHLTTLGLFDNADLKLSTFGGLYAYPDLLLITTALIGDADLNGVVDGGDFDIWHANARGHWAAQSKGDFNHDGVVDGRDFELWYTAAGSGAQGVLDAEGLDWATLSEVQAVIRPALRTALRPGLERGAMSVVVAVPEAGTVWVVLGMGVVLVRRRRRNRK
jgi:hypothetical protein